MQRHNRKNISFTKVHSDIMELEQSTSAVLLVFVTRHNLKVKDIFGTWKPKQFTDIEMTNTQKYINFSCFKQPFV